MPGMQQFVTYLKRDESRHIAFAVYYLSRLMAEHGDRAWNALEERMNELIPLALATNAESYNSMEENSEERPFNVTVDETNAYAMSQFTKRMDRLARARGQSLDEINRLANTLDESLA
jgi:ribonucleoside-diphosphate reductase beta chain